MPHATKHKHLSSVYTTPAASAPPHPVMRVWPLNNQTQYLERCGRAVSSQLKDWHVRAGVRVTVGAGVRVTVTVMVQG